MKGGPNSCFVLYVWISLHSIVSMFENASLFMKEVHNIYAKSLFMKEVQGLSKLREPSSNAWPFSVPVPVFCSIAHGLTFSFKTRSLTRPNRSYRALLHPFWNHLWSLQSDWVSPMRFIHKSHHLSSKSHIFPSQWDIFTKTQQPIKFQGLFKEINEIKRKWGTTFYKPAQYTDWINKIFLQTKKKSSE